MKPLTRRKFLERGAVVSTGSVLAGSSLLSCNLQATGEKKGVIWIDPTPRADIAPTLFMQFLEPLGSTEQAIEAAWDYGQENWREDVIRCVADLAPGMIRWGGNYTRYYKWKEGIGPVKDRPWMYNLDWGGKETNRVGTHEFIDFCRRVGAEPMICVNFMGDGIEYYKKTEHGENRYGTLEEALEWLSYCNDPANPERKRNGHADPFNVRYWQIGNETSYTGSDGFSLDQSVIHTREFAQAMKRIDPSVKLIGWGDVPDVGRFRGNPDEAGNEYWADRMVRENGDLLDMIAIHMMGIYPEKTRALKGYEFFKYPAEAWNELLELGKIANYRLSKLEGILDSIGAKTKIAVTEGHLSLAPYNTNPLLYTWLSAAYHARTLNTYLRHAGRVAICTGADFFGTRWTINAVKIPVPGGNSYLFPIGTLMKLYKKHCGDKTAVVQEAPKELDIAASRKDDTLFLHIMNTDHSSTLRVNLDIAGSGIVSGKSYEIAPSNLLAYVDDSNPDTFNPVEKALQQPSELILPPASVSVIELQLKNA